WLFLWRNRSARLLSRRHSILLALAYARGLRLRNDRPRHLRLLSADCRPGSGRPMVRPAERIRQLRRHRRPSAHRIRPSADRELLLALRHYFSDFALRSLRLGFHRRPSGTAELAREGQYSGHNRKG